MTKHLADLLRSAPAPDESAGKELRFREGPRSSLGLAAMLTPEARS